MPQGAGARSPVEGSPATSAPGEAFPSKNPAFVDGGDASSATTAQLVDLVGADRERAVPALKDGFVGIYRWHAKRTLRSATWVRAVVLGDEVAAVSVLERLDPEVGYVYYLATAASYRRRGFGARLLDDALELFRREDIRVVYGAAEEDNAPSIALFGSRGFRNVERKELGFREGGLGAWGLRSRMTLVGGEVLLGLRLGPPSSAPPGP